ncbi:MAG TPA: aldehyde dehydrogenase family protein [Chthonomonadales bacterium]|nr:aldehyde dehydrogenase family protein [Chthonomonadales bacterium]
METYRMYIDGEWCLSESGMTYKAINPATGEAIGLVPKGTREDARRAIAAAQKAQISWSKVPLWERAALCTWMAEVIEKHVDDLARVLTEEHGKPHHSEAYDEARETPNNFRLAGEAIKMLEGSTIPVADPHKRVYTIRQPRGVYAVITPWNFPMAIPSEYLPYAIVAGNTVCWAPAPTAALAAIKLMECMIEAGLPKGVINLVTGPGDVVGDELVSNPGTQGVGLTGSSATGEIVARRAGLKPLLMELGGNGPTVILEDADPVQVAEVVASACYYHAGQVCSSTERILVEEPLKEAIVEELLKHTAAVRQGDPWDSATTMGPLNNRAVLQKMEAHVADAVAKGAKVLMGGAPNKDLPGFFFQPTVLVDFPKDSLINKEESFGPIAPVTSFKSEEEAWDFIEACDLGLVSSVFTQNVNRAFKWAERLRSGITVVNDFTNYWELHIPFGGASGKRSGLGRIGGKYTLMEMTDLKTIAFHIE